MSLLTLLDKVAGSLGPLDPATLSPDEHYKEDGWSAGITWSSAGVQKWNFDAGTSPTPGTQNGLTYYQSVGSANIISNTTPKSLTFAVTDTGITLYLVVRPDSGLRNRTVFYLTGNNGNRLWRVKIDSVGQFYTQARDGGAQNLIINPSGAIDNSTFQVWVLRIKNVTGDGALDVWLNLVKNSVINASWTATLIDAFWSGNTIWNNDGGAEAWRGAFAEMIFFKALHTDITIERVIAFLKTKWAIT